MAWKTIKGLGFPYRINEIGEIQKPLEGGEWLAIKRRGDRLNARVRLKKKDGSRTDMMVGRLVWTAFRGEIPDGFVVSYKNKLKHDCRLENLYLTTMHKVGSRRPGNARPVLKIDRKGEIVEIYGSASEAARKNYASYSAMTKHCAGLALNTYSLGYKFVYEDMTRGIYKDDIEGD